MLAEREELTVLLGDIYDYVGVEKSVEDDERQEIESVNFLLDTISDLVASRLKPQITFEEWIDLKSILQCNIFTDPGQLSSHFGIEIRGRTREVEPPRKNGVGRLRDYAPAVSRYLEEKDLEMGVGGIEPRNAGLTEYDQQQAMWGIARRIVQITANDIKKPLEVLFRGPADILNNYREINESFRRLVINSPAEGYKTRKGEMALVESLGESMGGQIPDDPAWFERRYKLAMGLVALFRWLDKMPLAGVGQKDRDLDEMELFHLARNSLLTYFLDLNQRWGMSEVVGRKVLESLFYESGLGDFIRLFPPSSEVHSFFPGLSGELAAGLALQRIGMQVKVSNETEDRFGIDLWARGGAQDWPISVKSSSMYGGPVVLFDLSCGTSNLFRWLQQNTFPNKLIIRYLETAKELCRDPSSQPIFALTPQMFWGMEQGKIEFEWK